MTTTPEFASLIDVPPRAAWAHEAHSFTPWLAENLPRLSEAIGIPLELTGREVGVGRFSADILATNPQDGSMVLIENQLENSDHTHMGQILTYLAGLEAQVVIWLAPKFHEEHLSALRWLNQHTDERFSFFAVRLRVVQISNSPYAPLFDVLEKPNSWDRTLQRTARAASDYSAATAERTAFWESYSQLDPDVLRERKTGPGGSNRWKPVPGTSLVINRYKAREAVGLFIRGVGDIDDTALIDMMKPHLTTLETELQVEPGSLSNFWKQLWVEGNDPAEWSNAMQWLFHETDRYMAALQRLFSEDR
jgi:hypothetical protein